MGVGASGLGCDARFAAVRGYGVVGDMNRDNRADRPGQPTPNFFIVGAARSGTTALVEMLRQHPDVFITQPKEPHFLALAGHQPAFDGPGDEFMINRVAVTDPSDYFSLYRSSGGRRACGDASTSSLYYPKEAISTLDRYFPDARIVVVLREPVARAFSAYSYLRVRGFEQCPSFLDAVHDELEGLRDSWHHIWHYVGMGRYPRQLEPFLDHFGPERVQVHFYDDFSRDPLMVVRSVFKFLGVDEDASVSSDRVNMSGKPRSVVVQRAIRWTARRPRIGPALQAAMPYRARERVKRANLTGDRMPESALAALSDVFESDVQALRSLLDGYYPDRSAAAPDWLAPTRAKVKAVADESSSAP